MSAAPSHPSHPVPVVQPARTIRRIIHDITSHDMPTHEMRGKLTDWSNDTEDDRLLLLEHARAVSKGRPLKSYVTSAQEMSEIILRLFG